MKQISFSDGKIRVHLTKKNDALYASIEDLVYGKLWPISPLLIIEAFDKKQRRIDFLHQYSIYQVKKLNAGVHIKIGDNFREINIGLQLSITAGELSVIMHPSELAEGNSELYRLFTVEILPGMMQVNSTGQLLMPIHSGMLCNPIDKPAVLDKFMIYGQQERWELLPTLPCCAVQCSNAGIMSIAVSGAADTRCRVETDGKGKGSIGFGFSLRQYWPDPVDMNMRELNFIPIPPREDAVVFTAKRLRRHVMNDLRKPTLKTRIAESPELAYHLKAYTMKMFHGIQKRGKTLSQNVKDRFMPLLSFAEAKNNLKKLFDAGIENIYTQSVGWNPRGHDGLWPTRFPIEEVLGGQKGFQEMIVYGKELGYQINVHDNFIDAYKCSPDFNSDIVIYDIFGEPLISGVWAGGISYRQWPLLFPYERLEGQMKQMKDLRIKGMYYIDAMGNPLEVNYHKTNGGSRSKHAEGIVRILETAKNIFGSVGTECGFLYNVIPADSICMCSSSKELCKEEWPITSLLDKPVPLWQLALHGLVLLENQGLSWKSTMQTVLFGDHPRDEWSAHPGVMPVLNEKRIHALKANYDISLVQFGYLQTEELMQYEKLDNHVKQTKFSDGTEVIADFNACKLFVNRKEIRCPSALQFKGI